MTNPKDEITPESEHRELSEEEASRLIYYLENPPEPNLKIKEAFEHYQEQVK